MKSRRLFLPETSMNYFRLFRIFNMKSVIDFTRNYKLILLFSVSAVILFTAVDSSAQTEDVIATRQDTVVSIKGTNFYLRNMRLVEGKRNAIFKARVTHNGEYDWSNMSIYLTLLDSEGNIPSSTPPLAAQQNSEIGC